MSDDTDFDAISTKFEAVKIGMRHTAKDGYILSLSLHPSDAPEEILRDLIGTRYLFVAVRMDDNGEPVADPKTEEGNRALRLAAALCKDENFQNWMASQGYAEEPGEEATIAGLKQYLGIGSRKELKTSVEARRRLAGLREAFAASWRV